MSMHEPLPPIRKIWEHLYLSTEQAIAAGILTEEDAIANGWTPPPPTPRRIRRRWARQMWWYNHRPHLHLGPCDPEERL